MKKIAVLLGILLGAASLFVSARGEVIAQDGWSELTHVPSAVPARWTNIVTAPDLVMHAFWAAAIENTRQGVYDATYQSILLSQSRDGMSWSEPIDVVYDPFRIDVLKAITTKDSIHLFWNSDCVRHAVVEFSGNANNAAVWMDSQKCIAWRSIPEGIAVAIDDANKLYLVYSTGDSLALQTSDDDGLSWSTPVTVATAQESNGAAIVAFPAIAVWNDRVYVVWSASASAEQSYAGRGVFFAWSEDGGNKWSKTQQLAEEESAQPTIAVSTQGEVHLLWNTRVGLSRRIHRMSVDGGKTWSNESVIFDKNVDGYLAGLQGPPALIAERGGGIIALFGTNAGPRLKEYRSNRWNETVPLWTAIEGETWVTGLVQIGAERVCAYWNAVGSPSPGFSIRCKGDFPQMPLSTAGNFKGRTRATAAEATFEVISGGYAQSEVTEAPNSPHAPSLPRDAPSTPTWTTTQTVLMSTVFSLGIVVFIFIFVRRGMRRL